MRNVTIAFQNDVLEKIQKAAKEKGITNSNYIRFLVDLGLRIEEMSGKEKNKNPEEENLEIIKKMSEKMLVSNQEILYLTRYILRHMPYEQPVNFHDEMLKESRHKAKGLAESLSD